MITIYDRRCAMTVRPGETAPTGLPPDTVWIDLVNETEEEAALVEHLTEPAGCRTGIGWPRSKRRAAYQMKATPSSCPRPSSTATTTGIHTTPVGFVLSEGDPADHDLRQEELRAFSDFVSEVKSHESQTARKRRRRADGARWNRSSIAWPTAMEGRRGRPRKGFEAHFPTDSNGQNRKSKPVVHRGQVARYAADRSGRSGDTTGHVRDSLLGFGRLIGYIRANGDKYVKEGHRQTARLASGRISPRSTNMRPI